LEPAHGAPRPAAQRDRFTDQKAAQNGDAERLAYDAFLAAIAARDIRGGST